MNLWITGTDECDFEIPILPDIYGINPLDRCLGINQLRNKYQSVFEKLDDTNA